MEFAVMSFNQSGGTIMTDILDNDVNDEHVPASQVADAHESDGTLGRTAGTGSGAIAGGIVGSAAGPVGTVAGAVAGGMLGAAAGDAAKDMGGDDDDTVVGSVPDNNYGTVDTRPLSERAADAVTGDRIDDSTGRVV
jgi:phage tail tape-measure protein